jgi:hypothetical protein
MKESLRTRIMRWGFNFFPAYRRTGARLTFIADDWCEVRIQLSLSWSTRNYVGTLFGGSMYGAVDPIYMVMFIKLLGPGYVVWDKAAAIEFKKPGRGVLTATFRVSPGELDDLRAQLLPGLPLQRVFQVDLVDAQGEVCMRVDKTLYFRKRGGAMKNGDAPVGE